MTSNPKTVLKVPFFPALTLIIMFALEGWIIYPSALFTILFVLVCISKLGIMGYILCKAYVTNEQQGK